MRTRSIAASVSALLVLLMGCASKPLPREKTIHLGIAREAAQFVYCIGCPGPTPKTPFVPPQPAELLKTSLQRHLPQPSRAVSAEAPRAGTSLYVEPVTLLFPWAQSTLTDEALRRIDDAMPHWRGHRLRVTGFTDGSRSSRPTVSNQEIASARAQAVRDALAARGLEPAAITVVAKANCCFINDERTEASRTLNRRVEIVIADRTDDPP